MEKTKTGKKRYIAFISYSSKDKAFAAALEKALNKYKVPKGLEPDFKTLRTFRDERDLTGTDYNKAIKKNLKNSKKLIVLCSPRASKSKYVNDEIIFFFNESGADNIIPVIIDGLTNNEAGPDQDHLKAFPKALGDIIDFPLATDYRNFEVKKDKVNKGDFESKWYKLLADLCDQTREVIEQRDRKRRIRIFSIAAMVTLVVMLCLIGLTIWALIERQDAFKRRLEAERQTNIAVAHSLVYKSQTVPEEDVEYKLLLLAEAGLRVVSEKQRIIRVEQSIRDFLEDLPLRAEIQGLPDDISNAEIDPSENWLYASSGKKMFLWQIGKRGWGAPVLEQENERFLFSVFAFSPNGKYMAVSDADSNVTVWSLQSSIDVIRKFREGAIVQSLAFSADERWLAAGDRGGNVKLWDLLNENRRPIVLTARGMDLQMGYDDVRYLKFTPDNRWLLTMRKGAVILHEVANPTENSITLVGKTTSIQAAELSPQGQWIAVSTGWNVKVWPVKNIDPGQYITKRYESDSEIFAFAPNEKFLAVGCEDGSIWVWNLLDHADKPLILREHKMGIRSLDFSPDGRLLASGSKDGIVRLWHMPEERAGPKGFRLSNTSDVVRKPTIIPSRIGYMWVTGISFSSKGRWLITQGGRHTSLWDLHSTTSKLLVHASNPKFSHNGQWLATTGRKNEILFWNPSNLDSEPTVLKGKGPVCFTYDNRGLAAQYEGAIRIWDIHQPQKKPSELRWQGDSQVRKMALSPDGSWIGTAGDDHIVRLFSLIEEQESPTILARHDKRINCIAFSRDSRWLATCSDDGIVKLWHFNGHNIEPIQLRGTRAPLKTLAFSPDSQWLAAGGGIKGSPSYAQVMLWDMKNPGEMPKFFSGGDGVKRTITFSRDSNWLAFGSDDGRVEIWDVKAKAKLHTLLKSPGSIISSVEFSPDGKLLAAVDISELISIWDLTRISYGPLRLKMQSYRNMDVAFSPNGRWLCGSNAMGTWVWSLDLRDLINRTCLIVGRNFTCDEWRSTYESEKYRTTCQQFAAPNCE